MAKDADTLKLPPFSDVAVTVNTTSYRRWKRACPMKASLVIKLPPRAQSINVAQLKTLAEIVAQPELDRYELQEQSEARVSTTDRRLEYLLKHGLIQKNQIKERYHDRYEYVGTDSGIYLIRTWQRGRSLTELINAFQTSIMMTQGSRESSINVALLYVLKQIVNGRASTVSELMPLCNHERASTKQRLKNLVNRKLLAPDVLFNLGGNSHGTVYSPTSLGLMLMEELGC